MLPSSVRRVVAVTPSSSVISSLTATAPRAASAYSLPYRPNCHQRRYSSSKPSSPDNGPKDFSARASVPASSESKSGEKRKRRAKAAAVENPLPSVPSTQHLSAQDLALATFFAQQRPISVTNTFPKAVSEDAFAAIFSTRSKSYKPSDVMSTLSQTVQDMEEPMAQLQISESQLHQHDAESASGDAVTKIELKHADGTESSIHFQLNTMSGQFMPFKAPPAPVPEGAEASASSEEVLPEEPQTRVYKAILTVVETVDEDGQYKVTAHSPQLIEEDSLPRTFLERMALRQLQYEEGRAQKEDMQAISVRRQKKLKMKKKKYKKLMRRTRNLRRKLDRI